MEGQTIAIEYRWAASQVDRLPTLAMELVRLPVDLIVTSSTTESPGGQGRGSRFPSSCRRCRSGKDGPGG